MPPARLVFSVLLGGSLGAGGANALNHYLDRDIDQLMGRTSRRPLPGQRIPPQNALWFGIALNGAAFALLAVWVNLLSAVLTVSATLFYVLVYTKWLKRTSTQNIVIGGAAGAVPPLVGWAAVTGSLGLPALYLFALVFFWTPPHFWALALLIQGDYARAGVPMLPVVMGPGETAKFIFLHTVTLVTLSLLFAILPGTGGIYLASAATLGSVFLLLAWRVLRDASKPNALRLYLYSLLYLALLFLAIMVDSAL
jgi:protoheme IX farnesyltransferase